jgi:hypothetical protein
MRSKVNYGAVLFALTFVFVVAYVAASGWSGAVEHNVKFIPVVSWSEPGVPIPSSPGGAVRVDRDFGAYSRSDSSQFGDDRAYNSAAGRRNRESDYQSRHWNPDSYGQMGDYWYNSR